MHFALVFCLNLCNLAALQQESLDDTWPPVVLACRLSCVASARLCFRGLGAVAEGETNDSIPVPDCA